MNVTGRRNVQKDRDTASMRSILRCGLIITVCAHVLTVVSACHRPVPAPPAEEMSSSTVVDAETGETATIDGVPVDPTPERIPTPVQVDDPDRWLIVEKVMDRATGGWATGSFIQERNKLVIETHNVGQFAIDTGRIPIDWKRLVILGIDGRNSELRKRDYPVLHIARDEYGQWVVLEP